MFSEVKLSARRALSGNELLYMPGTLALLILFSAFSVCNASFRLIPVLENTAFLPAAAVLTVPAGLILTVSVKMKLQARYIAFLTGRPCPEPGFREILKGCLLEIILFFLRLLILVAFEAIPVGAGVILYLRLRTSPLSRNTAAAVFAGIAVCFAAGLAFAFAAIQRYSRAFFYITCYNVSPAEAIRLSTKRSRGKLALTAAFKAGFFPWMLLCVFAAPVLFVIPYYTQSLTAFYMEY